MGASLDVMVLGKNDPTALQVKRIVDENDICMTVQTWYVLPRGWQMGEFGMDIIGLDI